MTPKLVQIRWTARVVGALVALGLLWAVFAMWQGGQDARSLAGVWQADVEIARRTTTQALRLPRLLALDDIPADAIVTWHVPVNVEPSDASIAVWVERPRHAVEVWWDGRLAGRES
jgi:hypothetical protein